MPGVPFIYYGDEIGMRSPDGLATKEGGYDRTGARTPMQWDDGPNAGFSSAAADQLYLPVDASADRPTVAAQRADDSSLLNRVRSLIALRLAHPALCASGDFEPVYAEAGQLPFVFMRRLGNERILVALNPAEHGVSATFDDSLFKQTPKWLYGADDPFMHVSGGWRLELPASSGGVYRLAD